MNRFFVSVLSFLVFTISSFAEGFYDLKPNEKYNNESLSLNYMPFHNNKTQIYCDENGSSIWKIIYNNSTRERYVKIGEKFMRANVEEKYGTLNNFFVLYNPDLTHNYDTYWPLDAKIGDNWNGKILYFNVKATLCEFGDMVFDNKKVQYAKIIFFDKKRNIEGYGVFGKNIGLIEFHIGYKYLRLVPPND